MEDANYLIIGASAAGMAAAHTIRRLDAAGTITVLSDEPDMPYFRPMIPFMVSGKKTATDMTMQGNGPYTATGITLKTGSRVKTVDPKTKTVTVKGGTRISYGKVLLATGSRPYIPEEISGTDKEGVFALRTLDDARRMATRLQHTPHAVMLGGGLLNLKAAFALLEKKVKVTLIVRSPEVLSQLMDPEDTGRIKKALNSAGLVIETGVSAREIVSETDQVTGVVLDNGKTLSCQMVCIGKGVRPNTEFLQGSGIQTDGGIVADAYTACNLENTFTAGDVAVTHDPVSGARVMTALWTNAVEMGQCAGKNMAGMPTRYTGTFGILNATQVADEPFVSMGTVHTKGLDTEVYRYESDTSYRKIVFNSQGNRLIGALFIGDIKNAGMYRYIIREKTPIDRIKHHIIHHTLHYGHILP